MKKLCIFDFDGTIAETLENITFFLNKTLVYFSLPEIDTDTAKKFIGTGAKALIEKTLNHLDSSIPADEVLKVYLDYYNSDPSHLVEVYDGIYELIDALKENGVTVAVLSNKPDSLTNLIANHFFPEGTFYKCLGKSEKFKTKPDPEAPNFIAEGFSKENCYFIGDSETDIETAKNSDMISISVTWGFREKEFLAGYAPDYIVDIPSEILPIVLGDKF